VMYCGSGVWPSPVKCIASCAVLSYKGGWTRHASGSDPLYVVISYYHGASECNFGRGAGAVVFLLAQRGKNRPGSGSGSRSPRGSVGLAWYCGLGSHVARRGRAGCHYHCTLAASLAKT
jgi:hypothetical protein